MIKRRHGRGFGSPMGWVGLGWVWVVFFEIYVGLVGSGENNFI